VFLDHFIAFLIMGQIKYLSINIFCTYPHDFLCIMFTFFLLLGPGCWPHSKHYHYRGPLKSFRGLGWRKNVTIIFLVTEIFMVTAIVIVLQFSNSQNLFLYTCNHVTIVTMKNKLLRNQKFPMHVYTICTICKFYTCMLYMNATCMLYMTATCTLYVNATCTLQT
jgi:hypothetical protein